MTLKEASVKKNEVKVWRNLYGNYTPQMRMTPKFKVGDKVRITRKKGVFEKGYTARWTEEVFTVSEVSYTDPITYKIVDYNNEEIKGSFYGLLLRRYPITVAVFILCTHLTVCIDLVLKVNGRQRVKLGIFGYRYNAQTLLGCGGLH